MPACISDWHQCSSLSAEASVLLRADWEPDGGLLRGPYGGRLRSQNRLLVTPAFFPPFHDENTCSHFLIEPKGAALTQRGF